MSDGVPVTSQSRRRHASRLDRERDDRESQRRVPVSRVHGPVLAPSNPQL